MLYSAESARESPTHQTVSTSAPTQPINPILQELTPCTSEISQISSKSVKDCSSQAAYPLSITAQMAITKSDKTQTNGNSNKKQTHHPMVIKPSEQAPISTQSDDVQMDKDEVPSDWEDQALPEEPKGVKQKLFNTEDNDSNMYENNIHFEPDLNPKPVSTRDYNATMEDFINSSSPFFQFRVLCSSLIDFNPLKGEPTLKDKGRIGCLIRAIGRNSHEYDVDSVRLKNGLQQLLISPQLLQRVHQSEWPNEWIAHLTLNNTVKFLKYGDVLTKGIFCGYNKGSNEELDKEDTDLEVIKVVHQVDQIGGKVVMTGEYIVHLNDLPEWLAGERFWSSNQSSMLVQIDGARYKFTPNPTCETCGYEEHVHVQTCPYSFALMDLHQRIRSLCRNPMLRRLNLLKIFR
ncbi:hypothetical protein KEM48_006791 [Puccinia striiformis f. sp. tritici PST-130]|nr:hypothetical protein KEM48_006791 [Puccinia striiformis f. sp. tritici PST-130]